MLIRRTNRVVLELVPPPPPMPVQIETKGGRQPQDGRYAPPILLEIERYLRQHRMSASRFGRDAASDPRLVSDLRKGRDPSSRTVARIRAFMTSHR